MMTFPTRNGSANAPVPSSNATSRNDRFNCGIRVAGFVILHPDTTAEANPTLDGHRGGWIEIIAGGMFSGKSEELIRRMRRSVIARQRVQVFKPALDDRFGEAEVVSRDERRLKAIPVGTANELLARVEIGVQVVGIDEVQFFDAGIVEGCMQLADAGIGVIAAGRERGY